MALIRENKKEFKLFYKSILLLVLSFQVFTLKGNTLLVTNGSDSLAGSLRSQIIAANNGDTISILTGDTIFIFSEITIDKDIVLLGNPASKPVLYANLCRHFYVNLNKSFEAHAIIFTNGRGIGQGNGLFNYGGSILSDGNLIIKSCEFLSNFCQSKGGAICARTYLHQTTLIENCTFFANRVNPSSSSTYGDGGAVYGRKNMTIIACNFIENKSGHKGGAVYSVDSTLILYCNFIRNESENRTYNYGGAIYNTGLLSVEYCNFRYNIAQARYLSYNSIDIIARGGAIFNSGILSVSNSSFVYNKAYARNDENNAFARGGAIYNEGVSTVDNSTFYKNHVTATGWGTWSVISYYYANGGCLNNFGTLSLLNSTVIGQYGYAQSFNAIMAISGSNQITMGNTIVVESTNISTLDNDIGLFNSLGYNFISRSGATGAVTDTIGTVASPIDVLADTMGYYGGVTENYSLLSSSPAINSGNPSSPAFDQRNFNRVGQPDIGAHEYNGTPNCINPVDSFSVAHNDCYEGTTGEIILHLNSNSYNLIWSSGSDDTLINNLPGGEYKYILYNSFGCVIRDSIVVGKPLQIDTTLSIIEICEGDSVSIFNNYMFTSGVYIDTLTAINGCDSLIFQQLIVHPVYSVDLPVQSICFGDSVFIYSQFQFNTGIYYDSLLSVNGCDSIVVQELIVNSAYYNLLDTVHICKNDSALIFGNYQDSSSFYTDSLSSTFLCDSVEMVYLMVHHPDTTTLPIIYFCETDSVNVFGVNTDTSGIFYQHLYSVYGCDSTVAQEIIKTYSSVTQFSDITICSGDSVLVFNTYVSNVGVYFDSLSSFSGCDSVLQQQVNIIPSYNSPLQQVLACQGDSVIINGTLIQQDGLYIDSLTRINGCDSIINYAISFLSNPTVSILPFDTDTVCVDNVPFDLPIAVPFGGNYSGIGVSGLYFDASLSGIGDYYVHYSYIDNNGCLNSDSSSISVANCTGIGNPNNLVDYALFPNPFKDEFTLTLNTLQGNKTLIIYNALGEVSLVKNNIGKKTIVDTERLIPGIYFAYILSSETNERYFIGKLICSK